MHHQTGIAAITVTTLGYQVSHLAAAKVPSPVSEYNGSTTKTCQKVFSLPLKKWNQFGNDSKLLINCCSFDL